MATPSQKKGIALYIAVVVSGLVLTITISMIRILSKEYTLSSSARESQVAFYAADSGLECATYWDVQLGGTRFGSTTSNANTIRCGGVAILTDSQLTTDAPPYEIDSRIGCYTTNMLDNSQIEAACNPFSASPTTGIGTFNNPMVSSFTVSYGTYPDAPCAIVTVLKRAVPDPFDFVNTPPSLYMQTIIESRGYNTCADSPRRIERAIRVQS